MTGGPALGRLAREATPSGGGFEFPYLVRDRSTATRRAVLSALGIGAALSGWWSARSLLSGSDGGGESDDRDADARIADHRTTILAIEAVDEAGVPLSGVDVDVSMREHAFDFGTAVNAEYLVATDDADDRYRRTITDLFNKAVLENHHKWEFWEADRRIADDATRWLLDRGLDMRGHTCIWQRRNQDAIPPDVVDAMDRRDGEYVADRASDHVWTIVDQYAAFEGITEWDVLNEQVEYHEMTDLLDPASPPTEAEPIRNWFWTAEDADPDVRLYLNEYDVLAGDREGHRDALEELLESATSEGVPIEGLGLQSHYPSADDRRTPAQVRSSLDRFGAYVDAVTITEYDTFGDGWSERREAEHLESFLKTVYGHPAVDGFFMWGFWDELHWKGNAPLFRRDWSRKPAYDVYTGLVFDQWWTDESGRTDSSGRFETDAFLGDHEVTVRDGSGREATTTATVDDPTTTAVVTVTLE